MAVAIVLAAGNGKRMNSDTAKQFLKIRDKDILYYSLRAFNKHSGISRIILVTREEDIEYCQNNIIDEYRLKKVGRIIPGGKERYDSVYRGLVTLKREGLGDNDIVLIHDGVRPFVTHDMISNCIKAARKYDACTVAVPAKDTIKLVNDEMMGIATPKRENVYQVQTPQAFKFSKLFEAYEEMKAAPDHNITDDTMLIDQYKGIMSKIVPGEYTNIKITTPEDLAIAEIFAEKIF